MVFVCSLNAFNCWLINSVWIFTTCSTSLAWLSFCTSATAAVRFPSHSWEVFCLDRYSMATLKSHCEANQSNFALRVEFVPRSALRSQCSAKSLCRSWLYLKLMKRNLSARLSGRELKSFGLPRALTNSFFLEDRAPCRTKNLLSWRAPGRAFILARRDRDRANKKRLESLSLA